jgi:hypothetical protein
MRCQRNAVTVEQSGRLPDPYRMMKRDRSLGSGAQRHRVIHPPSSSIPALQPDTFCRSTASASKHRMVVRRSTAHGYAPSHSEALPMLTMARASPLANSHQPLMRCSPSIWMTAPPRRSSVMVTVPGCMVNGSLGNEDLCGARPDHTQHRAPFPYPTAPCPGRSPSLSPCSQASSPRS